MYSKLALCFNTISVPYKQLSSVLIKKTNNAISARSVRNLFLNSALYATIPMPQNSTLSYQNLNRVPTCQETKDINIISDMLPCTTHSCPINSETLERRKKKKTNFNPKRATKAQSGVELRLYSFFNLGAG